MSAEVKVTWRLWVPMRDGNRLSARLYRPLGATPSPAIVTMTPYAADRYHADAVFFAQAGYAFLIADCRGRGDSEGRFEPSFIDFEDGYDTVEWAAVQEFCDGQVAMWGGSYAGENQWNTLVTRPPHLRTIVPAAATHTPADYPWRGPVRSRYALQWLLSVNGRESTPACLMAHDDIWLAAFRDHHISGAAFCDLPGSVGGGSEHFDEYLRHPAHDPYWQRLAFSPEDYARFDIPILTIAGHYDAAQRGSLHYVREHERHGCASGIAKHFVVLGPWDHDGTRSGARSCGGVDFGPAADVDLRGLTLAWYDWIMRGGSRPAALGNRIMTYDTGTQRWTGSQSMCGTVAEALELFLCGAGAAQQRAVPGRLAGRADAADGRGSWFSDPADCRLAEFETAGEPDCLTEPAYEFQMHDAGLVWESSRLPQDVRLLGWPSASLWIETGLGDADLQLTLAHVDGDGRYLKLSEDFLRLRYRAGLEQALPCTPDVPMHAAINGFTFVSRTLRAGGRLRLSVRTVNSIHLQRNFQTGGDAETESIASAQAGLISVWQGGRYSSSITLPVLADQ